MLFTQKKLLAFFLKILYIIIGDIYPIIKRISVLINECIINGILMVDFLIVKLIFKY